MLKVVDGGANEHNARSGNVYRYTLTYKRIPVYTYVQTYTGIHLRTNVYRYTLTYIRIFYRAFNIVHMCVGVGVSISISLGFG